MVCKRANVIMYAVCVCVLCCRLNEIMYEQKYNFVFIAASYVPKTNAAVTATATTINEFGMDKIALVQMQRRCYIVGCSLYVLIGTDYTAYTAIVGYNLHAAHVYLHQLLALTSKRVNECTSKRSHCK